MYCSNCGKVLTGLVHYVNNLPVCPDDRLCYVKAKKKFKVKLQMEIKPKAKPIRLKTRKIKKLEELKARFVL